MPPGDDARVVQVMTLHKAKGLEFDAVILPGLDRGTQGGQAPLWRWKAREADGRRALVVAPMRSRMGAEPAAGPVYEWLQRLDTLEAAAELGRLLYVGATRARAQLHLVAVGRVDTRADARDAPRWRRPGKGSALERLWNALAHRVGLPVAAPEDALVEDTGEASSDDAVPAAAPLMRLSPDWRWPSLPPALGVAAATAAAPVAPPAFDWAEATAAAIGTVAHRLLAQIGREGLDAWSAERVAREAPRIRADLALARVASPEREAALLRVTAAIERTLADPRGRWLFAPGHGERRTEWELAGVDGGQIVHVALDHTFVAEDVRWIVDYKTGTHEGGSVEDFLARETERYRPQLERYARLVRSLDARPIRLALYYPLVAGGFRSFDFAG
jgi:ATP-dependent exoDNAse (exonuclease V) beta subunit